MGRAMEECTAEGPRTASPFYNKVLHLLAHYRVPFDVVKTGIAPPRPMLSDELNITYRKTPTLVLDGQMYLDTSVIAEVLEETFGGKPGHGPKLLSQQHVMQRRITRECLFRLGRHHREV